jgi:hypothetical protein
VLDEAGFKRVHSILWIKFFNTIHSHIRDYVTPVEGAAIVNSFPALVSQEGWSYCLCTYLRDKIFDADIIEQINLFASILVIMALV